jgi:hypothetical protein
VPSPVRSAWPLLATLAAFLLAPGRPLAEPTSACHCYQDRAFDPARPAAADPYVLATTRSSLLSAVYGVEKRSLVGAVMTGTDPDDLWVAEWAGARLGTPAASLLSDRAACGGWKEVLGARTGLAPEFAAALRDGAPTGTLAALAVADVLVQRLGATPASLDALRRAGATTQELILATVLAARLEAPTAPLVAQVHAGRATWGGILRDAGLSPRQLDPLVRELVAASAGRR